MGFNLELKVSARLDVYNAIDWYESSQPGSGIRFLTQFRSTLSYINQNPETPNLIYNEFREVEVKDYPYVIIYKVIHHKMYVFGIFNKNQSDN